MIKTFTLVSALFFMAGTFTYAQEGAPMVTAEVAAAPVRGQTYTCPPGLEQTPANLPCYYAGFRYVSWGNGTMLYPELDASGYPGFLPKEAPVTKVNGETVIPLKEWPGPGGNPEPAAQEPVNTEDGPQDEQVLVYEDEDDTTYDIPFAEYMDYDDGSVITYNNEYWIISGNGMHHYYNHPLYNSVVPHWPVATAANPNIPVLTGPVPTTAQYQGQNGKAQPGSKTPALPVAQKPAASQPLILGPSFVTAGTVPPRTNPNLVPNIQPPQLFPTITNGNGEIGKLEAGAGTVGTAAFNGAVAGVQAGVKQGVTGAVSSMFDMSDTRRITPAQRPRYPTQQPVRRPSSMGTQRPSGIGHVNSGHVGRHR